MSTQTTKVRAARALRAPALGLTLAAACAAALPVHAQERAASTASKQENIGVVSGLAVGAAAGGPFGAVIGAAAGAWLGDRYHRQSTESVTLATDLSKSESQRKELAQNVNAKKSQLDETVTRTEEIGTDVGFRTNDTSINSLLVPPLLKLGALAAAMPDVKVRIVGYADPRGSVALNDALSKHRAEAVAAVLAQAGVAPDQVVIEAHGKADSQSTEGDLDGYAFDRRVSVRLERKTQAEVASR